MILVWLVSVFAGCKFHRRVTKETETVTMGIDVARYQGTIDWQEVSQSDVDFAIVRVGYRGMVDGEIKEDPNGRYNMQEASKAGIPLGVYFFSTAVTAQEAQEEADWVAQIISGYPITYPVVYDCENFDNPDSRQYAMTKSERTDAALAFLEAIEKHGYEGMFYASKLDMELEKDWEVSRIEEDYKICLRRQDAPVHQPSRRLRLVLGNQRQEPEHRPLHRVPRLHVQPRQADGSGQRPQGRDLGRQR